MLSIDLVLDPPPVHGWVDVLAGPQRGQSFPLFEGESLLGHGSDCDVALVAPGLARVHARIACRVIEGGVESVVSAPATGAFRLAAGVAVGEEVAPGASLGAVDALGIPVPVIAEDGGLVRGLLVAPGERVMFMDAVARIRRQAAVRFELRDAGSSAGCRVNGRRVVRAVLRDGDELALGALGLRFRRELAA